LEKYMNGKIWAWSLLVACTLREIFFAAEFYQPLLAFLLDIVCVDGRSAHGYARADFL
jgi:hypothetical protein